MQQQLLASSRPSSPNGRFAHAAWLPLASDAGDFPKAVVYWNSGLRLLCEHSEALRMGGQ
jgi:hypothetical protein